MCIEERGHNDHPVDIGGGNKSIDQEADPKVIREKLTDTINTAPRFSRQSKKR